MSLILNKLKKRQRKAISPAIATIILIAVALVIALLVGIFAFGLFSTHANAVSAGSGNLYVTGSTFQFSLTNPSSAGTTITSVTISGFGEANAACTGVGLVAVAAGTTTAESCTLVAAPTLGDNYNYVINLQNGQSISGTAVAQ